MGTNCKCSGELLYPQFLCLCFSCCQVIGKAGSTPSALLRFVLKPFHNLAPGSVIILPDYKLKLVNLCKLLHVDKPLVKFFLRENIGVGIEKNHLIAVCQKTFYGGRAAGSTAAVEKNLFHRSTWKRNDSRRLSLPFSTETFLRLSISLHTPSL